MKRSIFLIVLAGLMTLAACKKDNENLIDGKFDGNVEIPTGMSGTDIIVTNFGEDAIPDENGDFAIGYSKMLVAKNAENNEPIYFTVNSTDFSLQKGTQENGNYELSAKETAIYFALINFPYGLSEASDEKFNALKNLLYSLDCVQRLEQSISIVVNQYGYLNPDALENSIEAVRNYFYDQLVVPIIGDANNSKEILLNPPHADPDHYGQLAKIEFLSEQYNTNLDSWDVLCRCWNGFAIWVGVLEGTIVGEDAITFNPEMIVDFIKPTTATDALSIESYLDWNQYVQKFQDLYGTISEYFNSHQQYFQTAGKSKRDVWFNLNSSEDAICYVGPEFEQVMTANCVGFALETVKFVLGQLIGPSFSADANFARFVAEAELDDEYFRLLNVWSYTHDRKDFKAIIRRLVHNMGISLLNHGIFDVEKLAAYNEYTAMYSAFAYTEDLALAVVEYANFNSFFFEVGGEHSGPSIIPIGVSDITSTSATVFAFVKSEGAHPVVERGFEWACTNPSGVVEGGEVVAAGAGLGLFSYHFDNLYPNTEYQGLMFVRYELEGQKYYADDAYYRFTTLPNGGGGGGGDHEYVDLGLPSGLLWATCNVGAENPEDYGDYFAWGETQPKDNYNWNTYQHCNGSDNTLTKYCQNSSYGYNGYTDELTTLLPEDDAATANWGNGWRMPTQAEMQELLDNTTVTWTQQNGVNGRLFTASNGNSLFLPAAGCRYGSSLDYAGSYGGYRTSSLSASNPYYAWDLNFNSGGIGMSNGIYRYGGQSVRPVCCSGQN